MSFSAEFIVGADSFVVRRFSWALAQNADALNRPDAQVQGGQLLVELDSQPSDTLQFWALDDAKRFDGQLHILDDDGMSVRKRIVFQDASCIGFQKHFDGSGSAQGMLMTLTLSANRLLSGEMTIDNEWPK